MRQQENKPLMGVFLIMLKSMCDDYPYDAGAAKSAAYADLMVEQSPLTESFRWVAILSSEKKL